MKIELIEGIGLWLAQRWGEYFAAVVTSLGLPYELYDIGNKFTWTRLILLMINLALVLYLLLTRRLFGVRGGKAAYEARLRSISVIDEAARLAEQHRAAHTAADAQAAAPAGQSPGGLPAAAQSSGALPAAARPGSAPRPGSSPGPGARAGNGRRPRWLNLSPEPVMRVASSAATSSSPFQNERTVSRNLSFHSAQPGGKPPT